MKTGKMLRFNCLPTSTSRDSSTRLRSVKDSVHLLQDHFENKSVYLRILHEALISTNTKNLLCPKQLWEFELGNKEDCQVTLLSLNLH